MTRRDFLRAASAGAAALQQSARAADRLNLLYIVVDQLSGLAVPPGNTYARMPNCEGLARAGVTFSHAYTAGMTCGPSRASLDTGLYTQTHGIGSGRQTLPAAMPTLPRGYYCC
jgi:arylsulfatase A-like enzyme